MQVMWWLKSLYQSLESSVTWLHLTLVIIEPVSIVTPGILNNHKSEGNLEGVVVGGRQHGCPGAATLADPVAQSPDPPGLETGTLWLLHSLRFSGLWRERDMVRGVRGFGVLWPICSGVASAAAVTCWPPSLVGLPMAPLACEKPGSGSQERAVWGFWPHCHWCTKWASCANMLSLRFSSVRDCH